MGSGKISPTMTHAEGPHVMANIEMLMQMNAIMADTAEGLGWAPPPAVTPTIPTMNCETTMRDPPMIKIWRRPNLSTSQKDTGVEQTLTRVVMS